MKSKILIEVITLVLCIFKTVQSLGPDFIPISKPNDLSKTPTSVVKPKPEEKQETTKDGMTELRKLIR